ncbi:O-acetyl-ADP-ribose deacetylase [bacterium]|nr:MAG: O-acetyl-ADP-ribose deacetylase [bacterium]
MRETAVGKTRLVFVRGDITRQAVDAIVNAANSTLMGGGGVDGAIHRAGGPKILEECRKVIARIGSLSPGRAVATTAGNLPAKRVIHTVGPVWRGGNGGEAETLASAYTESLRRVHEEGLRTVAFPSISTGAYGYPVEKAAKTAIETVTSYVKAHPEAFDEVRFVLFSERDLEVYDSHVRAGGYAQ